MNELFYRATVHPNAAWAVQQQARASLQPFARYLTQAVHSSRERQSRCALRWRLLDDAERAELEASQARRTGHWIALETGEDLGDALVDPRAIFCEGNPEEVWLAPRHSRDAALRVRAVDRERYWLCVERLPPQDSELFLPLDMRALELQRRAINQLEAQPLPHHAGLLRLCEDPTQVRWPRLTPQWPRQWYFLTDASRDGTEQQREFVARALATPDVVLLDGPPGSVKTTAICELVAQLLERGQRVLVCANTNVAVDNVLERMLARRADVPVDALRIGNPERIDATLREVTLDARVEALVEGWRRSGRGPGGSERELWLCAERVVVAAATLTGSTIGSITRHPLLRAEHDTDTRDFGREPWARPVARMPAFDVMIVDEASKTPVQEFLVPALLARRHVIVGDVRQLPPFTDRDPIAANLRCMVGRNRGVLLDDSQQRGCLLRWRLAGEGRLRRGERWLVVEPAAVLDALERELAAGQDEVCAVRITARRRSGARSPVAYLAVEQLEHGAAEALRVVGADLVLVEDTLAERAAAHLPANLLLHRAHGAVCASLAATSPLAFRQARWLSTRRDYQRPIRLRGRTLSHPRRLEHHEQGWLERHDWAGELTWRLTRRHELRRSADQRERERLRSTIDALMPHSCAAACDAVDEIGDVGLPSVLEVLQDGIGAERASRPSALTLGLGSCRDALTSRYVALGHQHRMHPQISAFPRRVFYGDQALNDANTIALRDEQSAWDFAPELGARAVWSDVEGHEVDGVNTAEVAAMRRFVEGFREWAAARGPAPSGRRWEVACLSFYGAQEGVIQQMLREVSGQQRRTRFELPDVPVELVCATVDRFQGREADLVLLSLRNSGRVGFLDSPNRLNVALTRARQQLIVIGRQSYFAGCGVDELEQLAAHLPTV